MGLLGLLPVFLDKVPLALATGRADEPVAPFALVYSYDQTESAVTDGAVVGLVALVQDFGYKHKKL